MDIVNLWGNVTQNIGFYTKETSSKIPNRPGIYAWYLPLWVYWKDMRQFMRLMHQIQTFDAGVGAERSAHPKEPKSQVWFNWDYVEISVKKGVRQPNYTEWAPKWDQMLGDPESQDVFTQALMKASIFSSPLYIGRADDLAVRYQQHVEGREGVNTFNSRFEDFMAETGKSLSVSDLLFSCIPFAQKDNKLMNDRELTALLEKMMLHICQPPFSVK